jgi:TetR/AcrR family transcriptional regulator, cholesterol catabolism regulator
MIHGKLEGAAIRTEARESDNARRRKERRAADGRLSKERWLAILEGASVVFRRVGYARARLEDVATEVGINRASLYYYVGTKEELLIALIEPPALEMTQHCREALHSDVAADEKLRRALRAFIDDLQTHPELFVLFTESRHIASLPEADAIVTNANTYGRVLRAIIDEGIATRVFRTDLDAGLVVLGILGMHNWIHRWYVPEGPNSLNEIGDVFAEMVLSGLRPT